MNSRINLLVISCLWLLGCSTENASMVSTSGQGGSMTRFGIYGNYLYVAEQESIHVYTIHDGFNKVNVINAGFGLETIFIKAPYMYLGAMDAMYIFSIEEPENPSFVFRYSHIVSCDPVVVQSNRAYVTLRSGSFCNRGVNALEIIDISDPHNPQLIKNYPMTNPHGLAVSGNLLILCEGAAGIKVFDIQQENQIVLKSHIASLHAYDVIITGELVVVTGNDGIFQYTLDYSTGSLTLLSILPVKRLTNGLS